MFYTKSPIEKESNPEKKIGKSDFNHRAKFSSSVLKGLERILF